MVNLYPEFYNDVFGPIMQPGSSSHMAGPCRIGYLCNSLLGENVKDITVYLDNEGSFAGTFGHMNEDLGMLNGAAGFMPDYADFFSIKENLQKAGIRYNFDFGIMKESDHLNAVKFVLTGESGKQATLVANSTGGGMVETVFVNDYAFCGRGDTYVLFVYDPENTVCEEAVCKIVDQNAVVLEKGIGAGKKQGRAFWFKLENALSEEAKQLLGEYSCDLMQPVLPVLTTRNKKPQLFDSMQTWRALAKEQNKSMVQVAIDYEVARGYKGVKEATLNINGLEVKVAIVIGIKNAKAVMDDVRAGKSPYHFIEVMACPGGCLNGGGAPLLKNPAKVKERMNKMYESDAKNPVRRSHENKEVEMLYQDFLKEPCGHVSHHLLHTHYVDRSGEVE